MSPEERTIRHTSNVQVFGRLKQGVSADQAEAELTSMARRQELEVPQYKEWASTVLPLDEQMVSEVRQALLLLLVAAGLVLLIACANVGNLLFARSAARQQEISMRIALGARRSRLVRQLLTESLVLAIGGSILGVAFAYSVVQALTGHRAADRARTQPRRFRDRWLGADCSALRSQSAPRLSSAWDRPCGFLPPR